VVTGVQTCALPISIHSFNINSLSFEFVILGL